MSGAAIVVKIGLVIAGNNGSGCSVGSRLHPAAIRGNGKLLERSKNILTGPNPVIPVPVFMALEGTDETVPAIALVSSPGK